MRKVQFACVQITITGSCFLKGWDNFWGGGCSKPRMAGVGLLEGALSVLFFGSVEAESQETGNI